MREILFRGKQIRNKIWIFGGIETISDGKPYICKRARYNPDTRDWNTCEYYEKNPHYTRACIEVIPETVSQYVGLEDKNGKKIFEGDIIRFCGGYAEGNWTGVVEYDECNAQFVAKGIVSCRRCSSDTGEFKVGLSDMDKATIEVIGNKFDNPDILEDMYK